jgi:hypothetical protein
VRTRNLQVLDRFGEFVRPCLYLLEQPRVLNGDDGLVGEGLHELN